MSSFNIRIYGIWIRNHTEVLVSEERVQGALIIKFPGGGLKLGEGTISGLKREWLEELQLDIDILEHFYTTDYYQPSAWDDSQVISIYYKVYPLAEMEFPYENGSEHFYFLPLNADLEQKISLPIDKAVVRMLLAPAT